MRRATRRCHHSASGAGAPGGRRALRAVTLAVAGRLLAVPGLLAVAGLGRLLAVALLPVTGLLVRGRLAVPGLGRLLAVALLAVRARALLPVAGLLAVPLLAVGGRGLRTRALTPVSHDRHVGVVPALTVLTVGVLLSVFRLPRRCAIAVGIILRIRRLSGAHRVTSLRLGMCLMSDMHACCCTRYRHR
ncbi:hypothetical protein [Planomonospora algeriensis]